MLIANDEINERILPFKGERAFCPYCKEPVIAVCGEINIHHWRHDSNSNCDPWQESETEWHRSWKENFPKEWREFIISKDGEKHIADIRTDAGLIVEFQNSSISSTTIEIREFFYEKMIWLINANSFKENFSIRSLVTSKLRENKHLYSRYLSHNLGNDEKVKELEKEISKNERVLKSNESKKNWVSEKIEKLNKYLSKIDDSIHEILYTQYLYGDIGDFSSENTKLFKKSEMDIDKLDASIKSLTELIARINNLPDTQIENYEKFKYIPYHEVSEKSHAKCRLVHKETINTFFPKVIPIGSESNFRWYSKQHDKYLLIIDLVNDLNGLNVDLKNKQEKREKVERLKSEAYVNLKSDFENWIYDRIDYENQELDNFETQKMELEGLAEELSYEKEYAIKELAEDNLQIENGLKEEQNKKDFEIKKNYKGLYSYNWKHRRKTWDFAKCPIYLDFGTHIFSMESENRLRKVGTKEFIETVKNWR